MHYVCVYVCVWWGVGQGSASALPSGLGWAQLWKTVPLGQEEPGSVVPGSPKLLWGPASIFIFEPQSVQRWEGHILGPRGLWGRRNSAQSWMSGGCVHVWGHSKLWGQLCDSVLSPLSFLTPGLYPSESPTRVVDLRRPKVETHVLRPFMVQPGSLPLFL